MKKAIYLIDDKRPSLAFLLLVALLAILGVAGGASQANVVGQVVVRTAAILSMVTMILWGSRPSFSGIRAVLLLLLASFALALAHLIPLPPEFWKALPGRDVLVEAAVRSAQPEPWRPLSMVPAATANAFFSLIVPLAVLVLLAGLTKEEQRWLPGLILCLVSSLTIFGLIQFSGGGLNNPLVNDPPGAVSATFANRNHFALFLSFGCMIAPWWAFSTMRQARWRGPFSLGLVLLFALTILATGSRAGLFLGGLALAIGIALAWRGIKSELRHLPRWVIPLLMASIAAIIAASVLISFASNRAESIERAVSMDVTGDLRNQARPIVLAMIHTYFPTGSGIGGFDPVYRISEPNNLLSIQYFNHAHNDFLEIAVDAGLPGLVLMSSALAWWVVASVRAWRIGDRSKNAPSRLGSAMILLVLVASVVDYPARTPLIMAMITIAAVMLGRGASASGKRPALPA